ncbi:hypothetical protein CBER1_08676 [Cercospora berteroae]|uniref:Uncharacterized protein n=1 Tax=Cercospora berteroae TaxID=357750 RepID=A0A2S6CAH1_9PEZI|nr:hypothetical protein CBER1_08676 [Cercospora berteroae]
MIMASGHGNSEVAQSIIKGSTMPNTARAMPYDCLLGIACLSAVPSVQGGVKDVQHKSYTASNSMEKASSPGGAASSVMMAIARGRYGGNYGGSEAVVAAFGSGGRILPAKSRWDTSPLSGFMS